MKHILLLIISAFALTTAFAQDNKGTITTPLIHPSTIKAQPVTTHQHFPAASHHNDRHNRVTAGFTDTNYVNSAWFDYFDFNYSTVTGTQYAWDVYPDSNLIDPALVTSTSTGHIPSHGLGMSLDPTDGGFYTGASTISTPVSNADAYIIDSFTMLDKYVMNNTSLGGLSDTLIIDFIVSSPSGSGDYLIAYSPASVGAYTVIAADDTPREFVTKYMPDNWTVSPTFANDCWDSISVPQMQRYSIPLTAAWAADTNASGYHITSFGLSQYGGSPLSVPAGQKVEVYAHFKSAVAYPLGTSTTVSNYYKILAGDPTGIIPQQTTGSYQCGLISQQQNDFGYPTFGGHNLLFSNTGLYNLTATGPFGFEVPCFSFHINYDLVIGTTLPIKFYIDSNSDCIKESTEPFNFVPILVQVDSNGVIIDTISATSGLDYQALGGPGTIYSFSLISSFYTASCISSAILYDTIGASSGVYPAKYYGLTCVGTGFDLAVSNITPITTPFGQCANVYVSNNSCYAVSSDAIVTVHYSHKYYFGGIASPAPASYTDSTIVWNINSSSFTDTLPVDLYYHLETDSALGIISYGDTIHTFVTVTPTVGDIDTINNSELLIDTVTAASDPNEMSVSPSGCISNAPSQLQYTINFMNVGNDTAYNIYVMDTLPNAVDPKSLRIVMSSNTMDISIQNHGGNNIVQFFFPNINLLDSTACPECSGAVIFTVNTKAGMPEGTPVLNHAGIFFDNNPVVMTDTVENTMGGCYAASVKATPADPSVSVYPNPATNELIITTPPSAYNSFTITNSIGLQMMQQPLTLSKTQVNVATLPPGFYYITFRGDNGSTVQKFVKL